MRLVPREERDRHVADIADSLRRRFDRITARYGIVSYAISLQDAMEGLIAGGGGALSVEIRGDDMEAANRFAEWLAENGRVAWRCGCDNIS